MPRCQAPGRGRCGRVTATTARRAALRAQPGRLRRYRPPVAVTRSIDLRTELPGPRSRAIIERKERVIAAPLSLVHPIVIEEARGASITDVDGNTFIDFTGGVGCL